MSNDTDKYGKVKVLIQNLCMCKNIKSLQHCHWYGILYASLTISIHV